MIMKIKVCLVVYVFIVLLVTGCVAQQGGGASKNDTSSSDVKLYEAINYSNAHKKGPVLVVLPGQIKSNSATFIQRVTANNIADFAELELGQANFRVLERSDLGPMINELSLAANMGDVQSLSKFKKGKFKTTKWFAKFDILKADKVAQSDKGFSGDTAASIFDALVDGVAGTVGSTAASSVKTGDSAGVWVVGLRYKILDASTSEQVSTGYFEDKMEIGNKGVSIMGVSQSAKGGVTLSSMVQRLVQQAVAKIDKSK
jgi:hypothetical protein